MADVDLNIKVKTTPKNPFDDIIKSVKSLEDGFAGVQAGFSKVTGALAGIAAVAGSFDFILDATREMEDLTTQFIRFTGSAEAAEDQLLAISTIPGPSLKELAEANRTLLSFGVSTAKSVEQLKQLNDVAAASGVKINDLADIFGKIQEDGNLTSQTYGKLAKQVAGFSTDFAAAPGIPQQAFKEMAESGEISSEQITSALRKMTAEGGKFFGAAEKQAQTFSGALDDLGDNLTLLAANFGSAFVPSIGKGVSAVSNFVAEINSAISTQKKFGDDATLKQLSALQFKIDETTKVLKNFQGVAGMSEGILKKAASFPFGGAEGVAKNIEKVTKKLEELNAERNKIVADKSAAEFEKSMQKLAGQQSETASKAQQKADEEARQRRKEADDERKKQVEAAEKNITKIQLQEQAVRNELLRAEADKAAQDKQQDAILAATVANSLAGEAAKFRLEQEQALEDQLTVQKIEALKARESELITARVESEAVVAELQGQNADAEVARAEDKQRRLLEVQTKAEADRIAKIRKAQADEFNVFKITEDAKKRFDEETWAQRAQTAQEGLSALSSLMRSGNKDAFNIGKRAAQAQALINIPLTAIKAYQSLAGIPLVGPALGAAAAGAAVVAGMAQLHQIEATQFAEGGMVPGVGNKDTIPGLLTPGEVVVPKENFEDLKTSFIQGSVANDQVILIRQTNALLEKILVEISFGMTNQKLTTVIAVLQQVESGIRSVGSGGGRGTGAEVEALKPVLAEIELNRPSTRQREFGQVERAASN